MRRVHIGEKLHCWLCSLWVDSILSKLNWVADMCSQICCQYFWKFHIVFDNVNSRINDASQFNSSLHPSSIQVKICSNVNSMMHPSSSQDVFQRQFNDASQFNSSLHPSCPPVLKYEGCHQPWVVGNECQHYCFLGGLRCACHRNTRQAEEKASRSWRWWCEITAARYCSRTCFDVRDSPHPRCAV